MLPKEELIRNIDELYEAYFTAESERTKSEAERNRLKSLNSALRKEIAKLPKPRDISELNEKISELVKELSERPTLAEIETLKKSNEAHKTDNEKLRAENESMRAENEAVKSKLESEIGTLKSTLIAPVSKLPREFLFIRDDINTGGVDGANFWPAYFKNFSLDERAGKRNRYVLYTGYLFERRGFTVEYCGITNGILDDGMDLICRKDRRIILVRCREKGINKAYMYYLAARSLRFKMDNPELEVSALCVTSEQRLSGEAEIIAQKFNIAVKEDMPFKNFPYVKCKVFKNESNGERRVYYTPNHRDYITVRVIPENGDMFCLTVKDAESKGFKAP